MRKLSRLCYNYPQMSNPAYSASLMCGNYLNTIDDLSILAANNIHNVHVDIMDGHFVPNITFGFDFVNQMYTLPFDKDIHLMMDYPSLAIDAIKVKKNDMISFHLECKENPRKIIERIKNKSQVSIVLNPETDPEVILPYIKSIDSILLMCIIPGFYGQRFIKSSYSKAKKTIQLVNQYNPSVIVGVDGAIGQEQILTFLKYGITHFVLGTTAIYKGDLDANLKKLPSLIISTKSRQS